MKIKTLQSQLDAMNDILKQIKSDKDQASAQQSLTALKQQMFNSISKIRNSERISEKEINQCYNDLLTASDRDLKKLKALLEHQKNKDEQERLRKIQEEMLRVQKQKEEEENQRRLEEEQRKQKLEIEARRKLEEETHKAMEKLEIKTKAEIEAKLKQEQEEKRRLAQLNEQERRDHDLAMRLAPDFGNGECSALVEPIKGGIGGVGVGGSTSSPPKSPLSSASFTSASGRKYDLSKWKYAELRDAINTSCDIELLEACREEFHRRLKVYHAWKSKNKKQTDAAAGGGTANGGGSGGSTPSPTGGDNGDQTSQRAPASIIHHKEFLIELNGTATKGGATNGVGKKPSSTGSNEQRYFRLPFSRPSERVGSGGGGGGAAGEEKKKGFWYSHFDGKWIARQMEIFDDKSAVLLVAGIDDMHMCELSLEETGLTYKQGAEILESEFETLWLKHGGAKYLSDHFGQISSKYVLQLMQKSTISK